MGGGYWTHCVVCVQLKATDIVFITLVAEFTTRVELIICAYGNNIMLVAVVCMHVYSQVRIRNNSSFHTSVAGHQCEHRSIHSYWGCKRLGAEEAFILRGNTGERCTCVVPKVKLLRPMKMLTVAEKLITLHVGEEGGSYFLMCKVSLNLIVKTGHCFDFVLL